MEPSTSADKALWLDRFVQRVLELVPDLDPTLAWRDGEAIYDVAAGTSATEAAEIWISSPLPEPGDLGESDFTGHWPESSSIAKIARGP